MGVICRCAALTTAGSLPNNQPRKTSNCMDTLLIDVPVPSMGATVNELTVIDLLVGRGTRVAKGQKLAELESDKSVFDLNRRATAPWWPFFAGRETFCFRGAIPAH